jgi:hypothetical protein
VTRDDRVLPLTRAVSAVIVPILLAAFVILYVFPGRTRQLWAWTIEPPMSAMFMGGGYLAGAYFFFRVIRVRQWHRVGLGIVAIWVFATLLLLATILHWDRFNHDHVSFWAWLGLYTATPVLLPILWVRNRRFDPGVAEPGERLVPPPVRAVVVAVGAALAAVVVVAVVRPSVLVEQWPWTMTPLTVRSLGAYVAFVAAMYLAFAVDRRWSSFEVLIQTVTLALVFIGVAAIRAADEFTGPARSVWGWRIGLAVTLGLLVALQVAMRRGGAAGASRPSAG